tara:strand:+ start:93 stop:338 length:246 start_codon:yes stop_codon:yes gene_type:complete
MIITKKKHEREIETLKMFYEKLLSEVSSFHQVKEMKINQLLGEYFNRFSNKSATKCINEIKEVMDVQPQIGDLYNGTKESV